MSFNRYVVQPAVVIHTKQDQPALKLLVYESPENYAKWEKFIPKVVYCMIPYCLWHLWKQNYKNGGKIAGCQTLMRGWGRKDPYGEVIFHLCSLYQYPGCGLVLWFGKMLSLGKLSNEYMISLWIISYNYSWIYNDLRLNLTFKKGD